MASPSNSGSAHTGVLLALAPTAGDSMKKTLIGLVIALAGSGLTATGLATTSATGNAASTACGASCMTLSSEQFGASYVVAAVTPRFRLLNSPPEVAMAA